MKPLLAKIEKPVLLLIAFICLTTMVLAQGTISGKLLDTTNKKQLDNGSVNILRATDSTSVAAVLTDSTGAFTTPVLAFGKYLLRLSYNSYATQYIHVVLNADHHQINLGILAMQVQANDLGNINVAATPMTVKGDTTEFNATMYKTKPNATAEDVLKKLPGIEVDKSGNVKAQGETVQRVLVNGKRYFGDDPKLATQNLPQDVIDKIQVFDDLSDQSKFTGIDDGNRVKTINITTRKSLSDSYFGRLITGAGNKGLYNAAANFSIMKGEKQLTVLGQLNNINKQNFTIRDILGSTGGPGGGRSPQTGVSGNDNSGLTKTIAGGINYRDQWGKNTQVAGSYFYNNLDTKKNQHALTENFYSGDTSLFNDQQSVANNLVINQRVNLNIETTIDSANAITIRPNISWQSTNATATTITANTRGKSGKISSSTANTSSEGKGFNGSADMLFKHKFTLKGRTLSIDMNINASNNNRQGNNYSESEFYVQDSLSVINQYYTNKSNSNGLSAGFSYTEPLSKNALVELNYNYAITQNTADRNTFNYDSSAHAYTNTDSLLTNKFVNDYTSNRVTLTYRYQKAKLNLNIGSGVQSGELISNNKTKALYLNQHYTNIYPTANLTYRFSKTANLRLNYSGRTGQPTVDQLQPVIDNSDPANIAVGNPLLKQSFTNNFRLMYGFFDRANSKNIFATINANFINNNIVNATITNLATGIDTIRPVNMNGAYNISAFFNYGFPLKHPKSNLNIVSNFTAARSIGLITTIDKTGLSTTNNNITNTYSFGETVRWTTNLKENFDMNFSASPSYNIARYSVSPAQNANYLSTTFSAEPTIYSKSGWILSADFNYIIYSGRAAGYNTSVPLLNVAVAKQLFKNKTGELRFSISDLFNQNVSIVRTTTENYAKDVQTKLLTRYAMLTFTYNIKSANQQSKKKQLDMPPPPDDKNGNGPPMGPLPGGGGAPPPGGPPPY